jgi:hypothetical protein
MDRVEKTVNIYIHFKLEYKLENSDDSSDGVSVETFIIFLVIVTFVCFLIMRDSAIKSKYYFNLSFFGTIQTSFSYRDSMLLPTVDSSNHVYLNNYNRGSSSYSIPSFKLTSGFAFTSNR